MCRQANKTGKELPRITAPNGKLHDRRTRVIIDVKRAEKSNFDDFFNDIMARIWKSKTCIILSEKNLLYEWNIRIK